MYVWFIQFYFSLIVKQALFAYVHHAWIHSWNQPVLSNEGKVWSTNYESDTLPTAPRRMKIRMEYIHRVNISASYSLNKPVLKMKEKWIYQ